MESGGGKASFIMDWSSSTLLHCVVRKFYTLSLSFSRLQTIERALFLSASLSPDYGSLTHGVG